MADSPGKTIIEKICEDLEKSGFAAEIRAFRIFQQHRWYIRAGEAYQDLDEDKTREIDLSGRLDIFGPSGVSHDSDGTWVRVGERSPIELATERVAIHSTIVAEVKRRRSKHWVVLKGGSPNPMLLPDLDPDRLVVLGGAVGASIGTSAASDALSGNSPDDKLDWFGRTVHETFVDKNENNRVDGNQPSLWHTAAITVCKAAESYFLNFTNISKSAHRLPLPGVGNPDIELWHIRPLVILDGQLFTAELGADNKLNVQEVRYAPIRFSFLSKGCAIGRYRLGIVTLDGLGDYLRSHAHWMADTRRALSHTLITR